MSKEDNVIELNEDKTEYTVTVLEFEAQVWSVEGVRIVLRLPEDTMVRPYNYSNKCNKFWTLNKWLVRRVLPKLPERTDVVIIGGDGSAVHRLTRMTTQRSMYNHYD